MKVHVVDDDAGLAEFVPGLSEEFIIRVGIAGDDRDGFAGQADHALDVRLAELLPVRVGAVEDGHLPARGRRRLKTFLSTSTRSPGRSAGVGEGERVIALPP